MNKLNLEIIMQEINRTNLIKVPLVILTYNFNANKPSITVTHKSYLVKLDSKFIHIGVDKTFLLSLGFSETKIDTYKINKLDKAS